MEALNQQLEQRVLFSKEDPIWKRTPFEHQIEMARFHYANPFSGDGSDVGTGKTQGMIAVMERLIKDRDVRNCLVVAPNTILDNWANEIKAWSELSVVVLRGTKDKRIGLLQQSKLADVYLINYEGVRVVIDYLMAMDFDMIVCDEVHHIKSYRSEQTKLILKLAKGVPYRKGMTGTLLTNSIEDLWSICQFINPNIFKRNFWGFRNTFMMNENASKPYLKFPKWVARPGAVDEIKRMIEPHFVRFEKREVLKWLPPVLFQKRTVALSTEQRRVYVELKKHFVAELSNGEELAALHVLARVTKLLEVCSGFAYKEEGGAAHRFEQNAKLAELENVLEEIGEKRVVIWTAFKEEALLIEGLLRRMGHENTFAMITGITAQEHRQELVDLFNADGLRYLICNASCAGEGLTILAPYAVYYSRGWKLGERLQSLGRHDRPGSEQFENVTVIDIVAGDSVDEEVLAALDRKEDLLRTINPESFRRMMK